jgi:amino acid adenylation domain-containing protein
MNNMAPLYQGGLPLSTDQKRLWFLSQQNRLNPEYNMSLTFQITEIINYDLFNKSLNILFNRQQTLFSVFKQKDGNPYIEIISRDASVNSLDFSDLSSETRRAKIFSFLGEDTRKYFNLEEGPLFRLYLIKEDNNSYFFHATIHHIIFDGGSVPIFANELSKIYTELINNKIYCPEPLSYKSHQFADLESSLLSNAEEKILTEFWKENLKGANSELKILRDFPRKESISGVGDKETLIISEENTRKLKALAKNSNSTLYKTLLSIVGILLQKYKGENDVCIGIPVSKRRLHPALNDLFGFFVGTSIARLNKETNCSFNEFLAYTTDVANNAIKNSRLSFDKIVEAVNPDRSSSNPLFKTSLTWWNDLFTPMDLNGIKCKRIIIPLGVASEDIAFYFWEEGNDIRGFIEYNSDTFSPGTIERLRDNLLSLTEKLCGDPDRAINSIPMITESDLNLISETNNTKTDYPREKTIAQLFEEQESKYPNKPAVVFKENSLTYEELNNKSNQLARSLRQKGVEANTPVGIMVHKSLDMIVGIFGILKAGGAYVPIDPEYPDQRISFILKDSGCKLVLTQKKYLNLNMEGLTKLDLESLDSYQADASNLSLKNGPLDLAYIIYTSGTTGMPKGTLIPQRGVVRLVRNTNYIEFRPTDKVLQTAAIVFDASTEEIFGALLNGATLNIITKETVLDPTAFGEVLLKNEISVVDLSSALFTQIAEVRTDIFAKVRVLVLGGDVVSAHHVNKLRQNVPGIQVINTYGPTENSCNSTGYTINKKFDLNIPIGKPISNSTAYIFDKNQNHQPIGIIGELYVGGDGLSLGYLNRDELNKVAFIQNPHNPAERLYKTGDLARWLPDGNIEFHGRADNQIKIRGYRVELEEIEAVISDMPGVVETVIKPIKVEEGDYKLVAFLNVKADANMDISEIVKVLKAKLPPYMVPSAFRIMNGFPKNINGKIDRKLLNVDLAELNTGERKETAQLSSTEITLLGIWGQVLKSNDILSSDNFFDIGGNSLLTIALSAKIENEFGIEFNVRTFFGAPRIKDQAALIDIKLNEKNQNLSASSNDTSGNIIEGEI